LPCRVPDDTRTLRVGFDVNILHVVVPAFLDHFSVRGEAPAAFETSHLLLIGEPVLGPKTSDSSKSRAYSFINWLV
jgi:hypothetical protein